MRHRYPRQAPLVAKVGVQRFINALARKVVDLIGMGLKRGAVNQNVELAKGFIGFINRNFVERQFFTSPEIRNQKSGFSACLQSQGSA